MFSVTKSQLNTIFKEISENSSIDAKSMHKIFQKVINKIEKPKKPKSAYMLYLDDFRKNLTDEQRKNVTQVAKDGGAAWRNLSKKEIEKYKSSADKLKPEPKVIEKKPRSPYHLFLAKFRSELSDDDKKTLGIGGISKKASSVWKVISSKEMELFQKQSDEEKKEGKQLFNF